MARRDLVMAVTSAGHPKPSEPSDRPSAGRCVLVIHRVVTGPVERDHDMPWEAFIELVDGLAAHGCAFVGDLDAEPRDGAVVLTFDDATDDHLNVARALTERGVPAVFFVPAAAVGTPEHLDLEGIREMVAGGHIIGSHGWSHRRLDRLAATDLAQEIVASRAFLEDATGVPVTLFAPAGGIGVHSLPAHLRAAGYTASRSTRWGIHRRIADRWHIPAVPVTRVTTDRGWVSIAATERRLPVAMIALGAVRGALGNDARTSVRGRLHRRGAVDAAKGAPDTAKGAATDAAKDAADATKKVSKAVITAITSLGDPPV
jgi:Polysaccharide deacetylase